MKAIYRALRLAGTVAVVVGAASGLAVAALSIPEASSKADLIVVGSTNSRVERRDSVEFDLSVLRTLKGMSLTTALHVKHSWTRRGVGPAAATTIDATYIGIWLLKQSGSDWDVLAASGPDGIITSLFWPAASVLPSAYRAPANASLTDALTFEVAAGAEESRSDPEVLLNELRSADNLVVQGVLSNLMQSVSPEMQAVGIAGLLERGQQGAVPILMRTWSSLSGSQRARQMLIASIRDYFRTPDPSAVQEVLDLARSGLAVVLRQAAIAAASSIHTRETLPFLASLLRSADGDERMKGVFGLSAFANGCPIQTRDNIKTLDFLRFTGPSSLRTKSTIDHFAFRRGPEDQEVSLVTFWTDWWSSHRELW